MATAKKAVKVIDNLLLDKAPKVVIEVYLSFLKKNMDVVGKHLDHEGADKLYRYIPSTLLIHYLDIFKIILTDKE